LVLKSKKESRSLTFVMAEREDDVCFMILGELFDSAYMFSYVPMLSVVVL